MSGLRGLFDWRAWTSISIVAGLYLSYLNPTKNRAELSEVFAQEKADMARAKHIPIQGEKLDFQGWKKAKDEARV
jgi:hypothetical protein